MRWTRRLPLVLLVLAPAGMVLIALLNFRIYRIPTSAMESTLLVGDRLLARSHRGTLPQRGEILVFDDAGVLNVKRVVAIAGDRVRIHQKTLFINGKEQTERYVTHVDRHVAPIRDEFPSADRERFVRDPSWAAFLERSLAAGEITVPNGTSFALGDNRDASFDSRFRGFFRNEQIVGRAVMILFSFETDKDHGFDRIPTGPLRGERFLKPL